MNLDKETVSKLSWEDLVLKTLETGNKFPPLEKSKYDQGKPIIPAEDVDKQVSLDFSILINEIEARTGDPYLWMKLVF